MSLLIYSTIDSLTCEFNKICTTTAIEEKRKKLKANCDDATTDTFIKICVNKTLVGNRPNGHFNKIGWKNIIAKFYSMTNRDYKQKQLKVPNLPLIVFNFGQTC